MQYMHNSIDFKENNIILDLLLFIHLLEDVLCCMAFTVNSPLKE